jgi:hypothetical protein
MSSRGPVIQLTALIFESGAYDMCVNAQTDPNIRSTLQVVRQVVRQLTLELEEKVPSSPVPVSFPSTTIRTLA